MRRLFILPLVLALACCEKKRSEPDGPQGTEAPGSAPAPPVYTGPPPLLDTKKIRISSSGEIYPIPGMIGDDAEAILQEIRELPPSVLRDGAIANVIGRVAKEDPARARLLLKDWTDGFAIAWLETAGIVASEIAATDADQLVDFIDSDIPPALRSEVWSACLTRIPPAERPAFLEHVVESRDKLVMMANMIAAWLKEDPRAAAAWLDGFAAGRDAEEIAILAEPRHFPGDPGEAREDPGPEPWVAAMRSATVPEARAFFARQALARAGESPAEALLNELAVAEPAVAELVRDTRIERDPAAYANGLGAAEVAALSPAVATDLIQKWARKQPRQAYDWAMEQGRPEAATAVRALYYLEPREALSLAPTLPPGDERDKTLQSLCALTVHGGDAETARSLLPLFSDPQKREATRRTIERFAPAAESK